jgi:hypothetical protein
MMPIAKVVAFAALTGVAVVGLTELGMAVVRPRGLSQLDSFVTETRSAPFAKRSATALGGRAFLQKTARMSVQRRENAIVAEIMSGNVPDHLRTLVPVKLTTHDALGRTVNATTWVLPDYLAIGSNDDYVRVPLSMVAASKLALNLGMALPTTKIVNAIYNDATVKLKPQPMPPTREMASVAYALRHNDLIESELKELDLPPGVRPRLIAGHKKDLVMTPRLAGQEDREAIFGWHQRSGKPIQPLSMVHGRRYADYSHGIRFVNASVFIDGRDVPIEEALVDRSMVGLLSTEGKFSTYASLLEIGAYGHIKSRIAAALSALSAHRH